MNTLTPFSTAQGTNLRNGENNYEINFIVTSQVSGLLNQIHPEPTIGPLYTWAHSHQNTLYSQPQFYHTQGIVSKEWY